MKAASLKEVKDELKHLSKEDLIELTLNLSRFKKENKELLTYLLFEVQNEAAFIQSVKDEMDIAFNLLKTQTFYHAKKSVRKILRNTKKYIRYSKKKETEAELLIYYCSKFKDLSTNFKESRAMQNIYDKQLEIASKAITKLHEDLQYDFKREIEEMQY